MKKLTKGEIKKRTVAPRYDGITTAAPTKALVIVPTLKGGALKTHGQGSNHKLTNEERLSEAIGLTRSIGLDIRYSGVITLNQLRPATLLGSGKVDEIGLIVKTEGADVVVVDHSLTPVQQRNLELAWKAKVLDRTSLILEIFGERAQSKEGQLQVELARLTNQKSRLVRSWTHLERQRGGFGFLGGPGETQIEADRRAIGERIDGIKADLGVIERTRRLHRKRRKVTRQTIVSLVGYTNAGKSTLFNALSGSNVFAKDMLFATLDPTLRRIKFPEGGAFILSDTVGFISNLPTQLIAAFRGTLEEIAESDLILHVRDIASPSAAAQAAEVVAVLTQIGIDAEQQARSVLEVWNKSDLLDEDEQERLQKQAKLQTPPALLVSAETGQGIDALMAAIRGMVASDNATRDLVVDQGNGVLINWLYEHAEVIDRQDHHDGSLRFQVRVPLDQERALDQQLRREF